MATTMANPSPNGTAHPLPPSVPPLAGMPALRGLGEAMERLRVAMAMARRAVRGAMLDGLRREIEGLEEDCRAARAEADALVRRGSEAAAAVQAHILGVGDALARDIAAGLEAGEAQAAPTDPAPQPAAAREAVTAALRASDERAARAVLAEAAREQDEARERAAGYDGQGDIRIEWPPRLPSAEDSEAAHAEAARAEALVPRHAKRARKGGKRH